MDIENDNPDNKTNEKSNTFMDILDFKKEKKSTKVGTPYNPETKRACQEFPT